MTVSSSTNRASYSGNGSTTVFAYGFKIFDQDDLTVILRASDGTETTQTITTHYTVSGVGSASGGNVTFGTAPASGVTVVILREQPLTQGLDLVANDPFPSASFEDQLDKLTFMVQQHDEELGRTVKASKTNTLTGSEFTISATNRANKIFAFDSSGDVNITQEIGTFKGNWAASTAYVVRDLVKDTSTNNIFIVNTAHTSSGAQPLTTNANSAKYDLIVDAATASTSSTAAATSATAAATSATAAASSATSAATAQSAAETAKTSAETAFDNLDDRYLGAKSSDPSTDNDGDALITGALYFNTTDGEMKVFNGSAFITITVAATNQANINSVAGNSSNINTVAGAISNVNTVAGISGNVTTVAGISSNVTAVAGDATDIGTVAGAISNVNSVAGAISNVNAVAGDATDIGTVAGAISNVNTVASGISNVNTVAAANSNIATVAGANSNISTVAGANSNISTVASNISGVNSFAERYRVDSSDPTSSLDEGDLAYNSTSNVLKYYNGSAWVGISPGISDVASDTTPQLGGNLDTNGQDIVTTSNADIDLAPNGTGRVVVKGNTNQGSIVLNCENNSHGITIQSAPHSAAASYTVKLPDALGTTNASAIVTADSNGVVSFDNGTIEESTSVSSSSGAATINLRDGNVFEHDLTENVTYTFSNPASSGRASAFILKVIQDSTARSITWPNSIDWAAATAPTITTTNNGVDVFGFLTIDGGTTYYGFTLGQAMG